MSGTFKTYAATSVAAIAGAALAALAGIPAGALIGSTLAVAGLATIGARVGLPDRLRDLAFATIGISLGSGIDESLVDQLGTWTASLAILMASLLTTVLAGRLVLTRVFGLDPRTATLASAPGTMSNAIAIAAEGKGDPTAVMFLQLMRLLILVVAVPPVAAALEGAPGAAIAADPAMPLGAFALLLVASVAAGLLGSRAGLPAASLMAGMVVSALGHATGLVHGPAPAWAIFLAFATTGAILSTRMSRVTAAEARRYVAAGLAVVALSFALSLVFAAFAQEATGLPLPQVWIAYAPGGVEAMAAIGLALGYDPAYFSLHHFARIFALLVIVPILLRV